MRPCTIFLAVAAVLVGAYAAYRMHAARTTTRIDHEEHVLLERARGHITAAEAEAIRAGIRLVRDRDNGTIQAATSGVVPPYTVGAFYDKDGGRDLIIDGPHVATAIADGTCTLTPLDQWVRPNLTVAHCTKAGFESTVTLSDMAGQKYVIALTTPGATPSTTAAASH